MGATSIKALRRERRNLLRRLEAARQEAENLERSRAEAVRILTAQITVERERAVTAEAQLSEMGVEA
jgi:hypothetical protein